MPRKIAGSEISRMELLIVASEMPMVVFESATHLYPSCRGPEVSSFTLSRSHVTAAVAPGLRPIQTISS